MHERGFAKLTGKLLVLAAAGSCLTGCAAFAPPATGPYPKFSDIPQKPVATASADQINAEQTSLQATAANLAAQTATIPENPDTAGEIARDQAITSQVQAPTDADAAATAAFLRASKARATPPPPR